MEQILGQLPQLVGLVEKGGVVGLLLIFCAVLVWEIRRLRKDGTKTYRQRDRARLERERYKSACLVNKIVVDITDIAETFKEDEE